MTIYVDVLICLNTFVNYFILLITSKINGDRVKTTRQILSALVGALFSLYIFVPKLNPVLDMFIKLIFSAVIVLCNYGFKGLKPFLRRICIFYAVSFIYAGLMIALMFTFRPGGMVINHGIVYFDISPLVLIVSTLVCYFAILIIRKFSRRPASSGGRCRIEINYKDKSVQANALIDTGHSLTDLFTDASVVVVDKKIAEDLLSKETCKALAAVGASPPDELKNRYRLIPYSVIGGKGLLPAFKCDGIRILEPTQKQVDNVIVAVSEQPFAADYSAILGPELINLE
ncbi:MAG TPA: sigma-E processing peptidase SpoIIGA [Clostridiales bacterium]|nr:sigma-E processing peptidase SpoIIGA [Clostridiales bacterium]